MPCRLTESYLLYHYRSLPLISIKPQVESDFDELVEAERAALADHLLDPLHASRLQFYDQFPQIRATLIGRDSLIGSRVARDVGLLSDVSDAEF